MAKCFQAIHFIIINILIIANNLRYWSHEFKLKYSVDPTNIFMAIFYELNQRIKPPPNICCVLSFSINQNDHLLAENDRLTQKTTFYWREIYIAVEERVAYLC